MAREKGLEPLAQMMLAQTGEDPRDLALALVDAEKGVDTVDEALAGARDIIAETINEDQRVRAALRHLFATAGIFSSRVATGCEAQGAKFRDYFDWQESVTTMPSHRILALRRGEREDVLNLSIAPPEEQPFDVIETLVVTGNGPDAEQVRMAARDGYKRLLARSMETEIRLNLKQRADTAAIQVFAANLRQLLLAPPLGAKRVMGVDPGFRTGCKVACLDRQGKLLHHETIYPHGGEAGASRAAASVVQLSERLEVEAIAVGNGTAGRETETFLKSLPLKLPIPIIMVDESGASVYSASDVAREEFPDLDLTVRGAVSIARRLMDPLSELVKIDPKSIGVGQYQHDVDQSALKQKLDEVVMSCVNRVGVEVNWASPQLLAYVSGLGPQLARNIVAYRDANGPFASRRDLLKVQRLGPKAFEQSAGFLRIRDGHNPLDASGVHPESYRTVHAMADDLGCSVAALMRSEDLQKRIDLQRYTADGIGIPTLKDILQELARPGRDPRQPFELFQFSSDINGIEDLEAGQRLPGIVTNVTAFGAFVDIGVHQDGLVHISQLADHYVRDPSDIVKVHQAVRVTVLDVDRERNRIALSMKTGSRTSPKEVRPRPPAQKGKQPPSRKQPFNNAFAEALGKNRRR